MVHLLIARSHLHEAVMHVVVVRALGLVDRQLLVVHLRTGIAMLSSDTVCSAGMSTQHDLEGIYAGTSNIHTSSNL